MAKASHWIAVVDDDPAVLKALSRLLRTRALHAKTFASAQEFLAAIGDGRPDCLIVDLQMPGMSGLDLLLHLTRTGVKIPTIMITAYGDITTRQRCLSAGAIAFLEKPLQDTSLLAAINEASSV
jgi:FixJ family two-component response regulator